MDLCQTRQKPSLGVCPSPRLPLLSPVVVTTSSHFHTVYSSSQASPFTIIEVCPPKNEFIFFKSFFLVTLPCSSFISLKFNCSGDLGYIIWPVETPTVWILPIAFSLCISACSSVLCCSCKRTAEYSLMPLAGAWVISSCFIGRHRTPEMSFIFAGSYCLSSEPNKSFPSLGLQNDDISILSFEKSFGIILKQEPCFCLLLGYPGLHFTF